MSEKREVQVIQTPVVADDGAVEQKLQVLTEGEIFEQDGRRFKIVKNAKGTLYKSSVEPLGQVGAMKPMSVQEMREGYMKGAEGSNGDYGASVLDALAAAKANTFESKPLVVAPIQDYYRDLFTPKTLQALSRPVKSVLETDTVPIPGSTDMMRTVNVVVYGSVRIANRQHREEAIKTLVEAVNDLGERGWIRGCLAPLSSIPIVGAVDDSQARNFLERLAAPVTRYDELVFLFPMVHGGIHVLDYIKDVYPKIFLKEGEVGEPFDLEQANQQKLIRLVAGELDTLLK